MAELGSVNVEDLGTVWRLFGALVSKASIPVPTEITQKVLTAAQHIGKGLTEVPGFTIPPVENLIWGQVDEGSDPAVEGGGVVAGLEVGEKLKIMGHNS